MEARVRTAATGALAVGLMAVGTVAVSRLPALSTEHVVSYLGAVSLLGAGVMVLGGLLLRRRRPSLGTAILVVGATAGVAAGLDTIILPALVAVVLVLTLRDQTRERV